MSTSLPSAAIQQSFIGASLNSTVMGTFLMGIYTMFYFGTVYLYRKSSSINVFKIPTKRAMLVNRSRSRQRMVLATITALYLDAVFQIGLQWHALTRAFVANGTTQGDIFVALLVNPVWFAAVNTLSQVLILILADVLLIWRCYFVWNRSVRAILLPGLLLVAEIGLAIAIVVLILVDSSNVTDEGVRVQTLVQLTLFCVSLATSIAATLLIGVRIHSVSKRSRRRFRHVIEIVVQSSAIYSLALIFQVACNVRPVSLADTVYVAYISYSSALTFVIAGLVPTVMVARVCVAPDDNSQLSTNQHVSRLQFQGQSASHNSEVGMSSAGETDVAIILPPPEEKNTA
ncbi:hypothetical protein GALMADRAFT_137452 [Galerina marginata CBS 339.88]|uniref:G-protein coupled receptors family 1 profile domain-containing protein n=1 Tax=Galerina marginata (strain CBS 339.88) TaxID=685588 RepID=A0A067TL12_GALM3|nr:hypothetical protein GALMADRAFT_137452 [Galerina marginata CBS 339.88]